jgi:hypothetical protein
LVALLLMAVGCAARRDPYGREALAGTVSFGGQPLDEGSIQFWPTEPGGPWRSGAMVVDGNYAIPREKGLPPGTYRVLISSPGPDASGPRLTPEQLFKSTRASRGLLLSSGPAQERIPAEYTTASQVEIEVRSGAENFFVLTIPDASAPQLNKESTKCPENVRPSP